MAKSTPLNDICTQPSSKVMFSAPYTGDQGSAIQVSFLVYCAFISPDFQLHNTASFGIAWRVQITKAIKAM
jgi:hypothetical protein